MTAVSTASNASTRTAGTRASVSTRTKATASTASVRPPTHSTYLWNNKQFVTNENL